MWNTTNADNEFNGNGGGGFDNTTNMFQSPATQPAKSKPRALAPVAIKQILDSPEEGLRIKGIDVQTVKVVGIVKAIDVTSIKVTYTIEDATGTITAVAYLENDNDDAGGQSSVPVVENTYCVLMGSIRTQNNDKFVIIFNIYPVSNFNEIIEHYLAVVHMSLKAEQMSLEVPMETDLKQDMVASYGDGMDRIDSAGMGNVDPKHRKVYEAIKKCTSDGGINVDEIRSSMNVKLPIDQIRLSLDYLVNEGHVFTTIDENHFKSTESSY